MLSAVERCVELIARTRNERIDLSRIPYDDPETYAAIQEAETIGVFQIESRAQMQSLRRTRPATLDDITIQVAIVRPGPIQGGAVNPYIERRQRMREDPGYEVPYEHPSLEPVLRDTLGTIIFQDQVLEVAIAFAGFSPGEAEGLRRAMSRKRSEAAIEAHHERFVEPAPRQRTGSTRTTAERVCAMIAGLLGLRLPQGARRRVRPARLPVDLAARALRPGVPVRAAQRAADGLLPARRARPRGPAARDRGARRPTSTRARPSATWTRRVDRAGPGRPMGASASASAMSAGCATEEVEALVALRKAGGRFRTLSDLASRAGAGAPALELLAWSGACDSLVAERRCRPAAVRIAGRQAPGATAPAARPRPDRSGRPPVRAADRPLAAGRGHAGREGAGGTQLALPLDLPAAPELDALSAWEAMLADYGTTGMTTRRASAGAAARAAAGRGGDQPRPGDARARHAGPGRRAWSWPASVRAPPSGIVFLLLEDEFGTINLIVPPPIYERHRLIVRTEPLMLVEGKLEKLRRGRRDDERARRPGRVDRGARSACSPRSRTSRCSTSRSRRGLAEQKAAPAERGRGLPAVAPPV